MGDLISLSAVYIMLFFLGMTILRTGLYQLSYHKMEYFLAYFTRNTYLGVLTGLIATAILQSSSIVMVLTISFVSMGFLSFKQSIGIMFGANIGTTVTGELMAFSNLIPEITFVVLGAILIFMKNKVLFCIGTILCGLGSIFVALNGFESLVEYINHIPILNNGIQYASSNPSTGVWIGTVISGIIQSSSATIGLTMSFLHEHALTLSASIAVVLGANIGTCVTSILATLGTEKEAKLVAMSHVWFNVLGVIFLIPFLGYLTNLAELLAADAKEQLAHISVLFNLLSVLCFLPFVGLFERFIVRMHGN